MIFSLPLQQVKGKDFNRASQAQCDDYSDDEHVVYFILFGRQLRWGRGNQELKVQTPYLQDSH